MMSSNDSQDGTLNDLIAAVIRNDDGTVKSLLTLAETKSEIDQWNSMSKTPLGVAVDYGNVRICRLLLDSGANVNTVSYSQTTCAYETPLTTAIRLNDTKLIELLLQYIQNIAEDADSGKTALHWAASYGNITIAETLISRGADLNRFGPSNNTALHYATISDKSEMVLWLLQHGASDTLNNEGRSALHIAAVRGSVDIVRHLLDAGCTTISRDNFNFSPLALACLRNHMTTVRHLAESKLNVDLSDGLRRAAESGHVDVMRYLLTDPRCNIDSTSDHGETALCVAAARGQYQAVKFLLDLGARMDIADNRGDTPLTAALAREHVDIITTLIISGAPLFATERTINPLKMALDLANPVIIKYLLLAGCSRQGYNLEESLSTSSINDRLRDVDYMAAAASRFKWETQVLRNTWRWLETYICQTATLKQWCRINMRRHLSTVYSGRSILNQINELHLPSVIRCYLSFDNVLNE